MIKTLTKIIKSEPVKKVAVGTVVLVAYPLAWGSMNLVHNYAMRNHNPAAVCEVAQESNINYLNKHLDGIGQKILCPITLPFVAAEDASNRLYRKLNC